MLEEVSTPSKRVDAKFAEIDEHLRQSLTVMEEAQHLHRREADSRTARSVEAGGGAAG